MPCIRPCLFKTIPPIYHAKHKKSHTCFHIYMTSKLSCRKPLLVRFWSSSKFRCGKIIKIKDQQCVFFNDSRGVVIYPHTYPVQSSQPRTSLRVPLESPCLYDFPSFRSEAQSFILLDKTVGDLHFLYIRPSIHPAKGWDGMKGQRRGLTAVRGPRI